MSCYHPLIGIYIGEKTKNGGNKIKIMGAADNYTMDEFKRNGNGILIPCGKCIGCRLDYSRNWADRMMLELETAKKAVFLTLTYNDNALNGFDYDGKYFGSKWTQFDEFENPLYATLDKREPQLWMKRLRKEFAGNTLRYYLCGEYGSKTYRPHYHAIIFGIDRDDIGDCKLYKSNNLSDNMYTSERLNKTWKRGFVVIEDVSWHTCAYTARYVTKKMCGKMEELYAFRNVEKEFCLMSRNPGLGADYLKLHPDALDMQNINISTPEGGRKIRIPKYYLRKLKESGDESDRKKYDDIMKIRKMVAEDSNMIKLSLTDTGFYDMLGNEEFKKLNDTKILKRIL